MQFPKYVLPILCCFIAPSCQAGQSTQASAPQAVALLQQSLVALSGGTSITDVTLSGVAQSIAGSDDETGTTVLKALVTGETSSNFDLPSGKRSEIHANSTSGPIGQWTGLDSKPHSISQPNLMIESCWFFPALAVRRVLVNTEYVISYIGNETRNGESVEHVIVYRLPQATGAPADWLATIQHLTKLDIFLSSSTLQPSAVLFNTHPDNDSNIDIPTEIRFSDYQPTNGLVVPMHVQRFLNNALAFDIHIQSVVLNSGLTANAFALQ